MAEKPDRSLVEDEVSEIVASAVRRRQKAKTNKDYELADTIREQLRAAGIILHDKSDGSANWEIPVSVDLSKLESLK